MSREESERLLNEIGQLLAEDRDYPLDGTLLYARVDRNFVAPSIYKDRGSDVLYRWPDLDGLSELLLDLWDAEGNQDHWSEIAYLVRGGRFEATYTYPDQIDPDEDPMDRRDRVVRSYFGDKPIVYPPWPAKRSSPGNPRITRR